MGRNIEKTLSKKVISLPVGSVIEVSKKEMTLVRYHARGCRQIKSREDLRTGRQEVLLGEFF